MKNLTIKKKNISIFPSKFPNMPIIYLNNYKNDNGKIYKEVKKFTTKDFSLVVISNLEWDNDMAPWDIPPITKFDTPCKGGAEEYLNELIEQIIPEAEKYINGIPNWRGLVGYSLAGLFSIFSIYKTDIFNRFASMSGSLWFPKIIEYISENEMIADPQCIYFSLGDKECRTNNPFLKVVQKNTEEIYNIYSSYGINCYYELNPGNHYCNSEERTAKGINWLLKN